ncbi:MAG: PASTA domain-containing protein [Candidatus Riflebacteria bacterium]|nr:PASTA domain-containing protein [Candidatus Riflebacteria bacterium]
MARKESCLLIILKMLLMLVLLIALIIAGVFYIRDFLNEYFNRGETIEVPDFRGKHLVEVFKEKPADLMIEKRDEKCDPRYPKDHVIAQYPEPGTRVKKNKKVLLTISLGSKQVTVPDLTGKSTRESALSLLNAQLKEGNHAYFFSTKVPRDHIVTQSPLPFSTQSVNGSVDLLISLGPAPVRGFLPNLAGKSINDAKKVLSDCGLKLGKLLYKKDSVHEPDRILSTKPSPYEVVNDGTTIDVLLSSLTTQSSPEEMKKFSVLDNSVSLTVPDKPEKPSTSNDDDNPEVPVKPKSTGIEPPKIILPGEDKTATKKPSVESDASENNPSGENKPSGKPENKPEGKAESGETTYVTFTMPDGFMAKEVKFLLVSPQGRQEVYSDTHKPLDQIKVKVPKVPDGKVQVYINNILVEELSL